MGNIKTLIDLSLLPKDQIKHFIGNRFVKGRPINTRTKSPNRGDVLLFDTARDIDHKLDNCSNMRMGTRPVFYVETIEESGQVVLTKASNNSAKEHFSYGDLFNSKFLNLSKLTEKELEKFLHRMDYLNTEIFREGLKALNYEKILYSELLSILPEERFEIKRFTNSTYDDYSVLYYEIVIHVEDFNITNSLELTHPTKDFFIKFIISIDSSTGRFALRSPSVTKRTFNIKDFYSNGNMRNYPYIQSHVHPEDIDNTWYAGICYGQTPLREAVNRHTGNYKPIEDLNIFILNFIDFMKWESLEGIPYVSISTLKNPKPVISLLHSQRQTLKKKAFERLFSKYSIEELTANCGITFKDNNITLDPNFYTTLTSLIEEVFDESEKVYVDEQGLAVASPNPEDYDVERALKVLDKRGFNKNFIFRGKNFSVKIDGIDNSDDSVKYTKRVHPEVLKAVIQEIEKELTLTFNTFI